MIREHTHDQLLGVCPGCVNAKVERAETAERRVKELVAERDALSDDYHAVRAERDRLTEELQEAKQLNEGIGAYTDTYKTGMEAAVARLTEERGSSP